MHVLYRLVIYIKKEKKRKSNYLKKKDYYVIFSKLRLRFHLNEKRYFGKNQ